MNFRKIYLKIINKAKLENRVKNKINYYELHHILPASLFPKWSKRNSNLVLLTAREHFFCHQLLYHIYPCKEMASALWLMSHVKKYKAINSREYQRLKKEISKIRGDNIRNTIKKRGYWFTENGKKNILKAITGRVVSPETLEKMSKNRRGKGTGPRPPLSEERKNTISATLKRKYESKEIIGYFTGKGYLLKGEKNPFYGKTHSEEYKRNLSNIMKTVKPGDRGTFGFGKNHPYSVWVRCITIDKIFYSLNEALKYIGMKNTGSLRRSCETGKSFGKHPDTLEPLFWEYYGQD